MIGLASHIWPALAAVFLLGLLFGGLSRAPEGLRNRHGQISLAALVVVLAALCLSAALDLVPGRPGLWLDSALLHLAAYLIGCGLGWFMARYRAGRRAAAQDAG